ncbi:hypothetical protein COT42_06975 [Candidatus Saganbacteria bacterium CG08_land_8_20_14_0_20_45_16]|uniref:Lipoprotein LpqB beta-propeller domain-containing protein n=1 Tax=Candidatus Saganbacteria bacterium CG08_land_8_20_14_0_20_45_16 TaxID=2014293 RepID=A0A2H0XXE0_UNCSA|nr:MAG: hypothetical protein COT42_06975 [Candidatus Saganbacteria bacterium CG08_land_8_20_14_0_20_45_16]
MKNRDRGQVAKASRHQGYRGRAFVFCFLVLLFGAVLAGCGVQTSTHYYYYSPSWARDGKLIYLGATESVNRDILGGQLSSNYAEYTMTIYPSGTGESGALFDTTSARPYEMTCSPTTDYVAYGDSLRSGLYRRVVLRNIAAGTHTGLEQLELAFSPGIKSFDWSNDGIKLVYCTSTEIHTVDINGDNDTLVVADSNLEFVAWKYGGRIAFVRTSGADKILSLIYADGSGRTDLAAASSVDLPQISSTNTDEVYGVVGSTYKKVVVSSRVRSDLIASFTGEFPRLSPDTTLLTYSKSTETTGIYLYDLSAGTETQVK